MEYIVYHGTGSSFRRFNLKYSTQGIIWFTDNKQDILDGNVGAQGKGYILTCKITINNPCGWDEYEKLTLGQIEGKGYDGIILPEENENTYIVFNPKQVKIINKEILKESFIEKILKESNQSNKQELLEKMIYNKVKSSNIKKVGYDDKTKILELQFHSGGIYQYEDVPKSIFTKLLKSASKGKFAHKNIIWNYNYERI